MSAYEELKTSLRAHPKTWVVTGVAGFIGSHLLERLLELGQKVRGLDNFETGHAANLEEVRTIIGEEKWSNFRMTEDDICDPAACAGVCEGADYVLHEAALGSVPRSIAEPLASHDSNVTGFVNMLLAARDAKVQRFVFASSSAVYGDSPELPKVEGKTGRLLSPYAATKAMNEMYADVFARCYRLSFVGLRYFNVFGLRQDPEGAYAAVIPKWIAALLDNQPVQINGDGETSRDFCFVENVVQANLLAATTNNSDAINQCYNIAVGERTTLNELFELLKSNLQPFEPAIAGRKAIYQDFRAGDVRHSLADISKARRLLGYEPQFNIKQGLELAMDWYRQSAAAESKP
ncbi:MAG TPA: SDR family oxidoreductase [Candidatus Dormibacteraeota bacterium]|nr:SDR family oxidoreductase [Candidatus Dormibacteraeota bacterium]